MLRTLGFCLSSLVLAACASAPPEPVVATVSCSTPRPQVCTMEYAPVCAKMIRGGSRQYSSGCNACADDQVAAYLSGECPQ